VAACKRTRRAPPAVAKDVAEAPVYTPPKLESTPATTKLLDAGKSPRQLLRFALTPGQKEVGTLVMDITIQMKDGEENHPAMQFPLIKLGMEMEVQAVTPEGDATYQFKFVSSEVVDRGDAAMGALMDFQTKRIVGLTGGAVITSRGVAKSTELHTPEQVDDQTRQLIESLKQSAANFAPPLPEEPVGLGATWVETAVVIADGMKVTKTTNYKVVALEKGKVRLEVVSQHVGDPKDYAPSAPPGTRIELKEYQGTVSGEVTVELAHVLAPSTQKAETVVDVFVSTPQEDKAVRTTTTQIMTVADTKADVPPPPAKGKGKTPPAKKAAAAAPGAPAPQ